MKPQIAIINRGIEYGTLDGRYTKNDEIFKLIAKALKQDRASLLIDNDDTLAYNIFQTAEEKNK